MLVCPLLPPPASELVGAEDRLPVICTREGKKTLLSPHIHSLGANMQGGVLSQNWVGLDQAEFSPEFSSV